MRGIIGFCLAVIAFVAFAYFLKDFGQPIAHGVHNATPVFHRQFHNEINGIKAGINEREERQQQVNGEFRAAIESLGGRMDKWGNCLDTICAGVKAAAAKKSTVRRRATTETTRKEIVTTTTTKQTEEVEAPPVPHIPTYKCGMEATYESAIEAAKHTNTVTCSPQPVVEKAKECCNEQHHEAAVQHREPERRDEPCVDHYGFMWHKSRACDAKPKNCDDCGKPGGSRAK